MSLNDRQIRNAKPRSSVYRIRDLSKSARGFGIAISPNGAKTFFLSYTSPIDGKRRQISIDRYPKISLKDAREAAAVIRQQVEGGIDPAIRKAEAKQDALLSRTTGTVGILFDFYIQNLETDGKRSAREVRRIYNKHIAPVIGDAVASEVSADDILAVTAPIAQRGAVIHSDNVRAYLRAAFEFAIHARQSPRWRGRIPNFNIVYNPVVNTRRAVVKKVVGNRSLNKAEIIKIWHASGLSDSSRLALKFIVATGQRVEEVLQAPWSEFDFEDMTWSIPAARRKTRRQHSEPHVVPLHPFHIRILDEIRIINGHPVWLFPHQSGSEPRKADALRQATSRFCIRNDIPSFSPRDLRRTFKTLSGALGLSLEIRNRIQGHAMSDVGSVYYDRYEYLQEKRIALKSWSQWLIEQTK